jgi:hypothetical protein
MRPLEELEEYQGVAGSWFIPADALTSEQYTASEFDLEIGSPHGARIATVRRRLAVVGIAALHGNPPVTTFFDKKLLAMVNDFQIRFPKELDVSTFVDRDTWYLLNQMAWEFSVGKRTSLPPIPVEVPIVVVKPTPPTPTPTPPPPPPPAPPGATPAQIAQAQIAARLAAQRAAEGEGVSVGAMIVIALVLIALAMKKREGK